MSLEQEPVFDGRAMLAHLSREEARMLPRGPGSAHDWRPPYDASALPVRVSCNACMQYTRAE